MRERYGTCLMITRRRGARFIASAPFRHSYDYRQMPPSRRAIDVTTLSLRRRRFFLRLPPCRSAYADDFRCLRRDI